MRCEQPDDYECLDERELFEELKRSLGKKNLRKEKPESATDGPCRVDGPYVPGTHVKIKDGGKPLGTIACCMCCDDSSGKADLKTKCRFLEGY